MTPKEQKRLMDLVEQILRINYVAYTRLIENIENEDEYCPRKEINIKAAAWEMINDEIKLYMRKENDNG